MANDANQKKKGGRPLSYPPEMVYEIIEFLLESGTPSGRIDAALVKEQLCKVHDIKGTIRLESLQKVVEDAVAELQHQQERTLLEALPEAVIASVDHFMKGARDAFAIMIAEQNAKCQADANAKCDEIRTDKRYAQFKNTELVAENAQLENDKLMLVAQRDRSDADLIDLRKQLYELEQEINHLRGANEFAQSLITQL